MRTVAILGALAAALLPAAAWAEPQIDTDNTVFEGDYVILMAGPGYLPSYQGSDDYRALPLAGAIGEVGGYEFTIRGPSLTVRVVDVDVADNVDLFVSPQVRYRANRTGGIGDEVVARLPRLDGVVEAGVRAGLTFDELVSKADSLSVGVSTRWDVSGKGSGMIVAPSAIYRLPVSRAQAFGLYASAQWVDDKYADYNYSISPQGAIDSGLPAYRAKGGFNEWSLGLGTARDLSGNALDGGLAVGLGAVYTRLYGSAAKSPITSIRGSRDQWFVAGGLAYTF